MVAAFEAAIAKAIDYSKKPPEDFVDQASLAPRAPPQAHQPCNPSRLCSRTHTRLV